MAAAHGNHAWLRSLLGAPAGTRFACFHDYGAPELALLANLPNGASSVRAGVVFPEGPLHAASPRPDSTANHFCLGCHVDDGVAPPSLLPAALALDAGLLPAKDDPRRQPMQTPALIFGNVPLDHFVNADPDSLPSAAFTAPAGGTQVDPYVIP